MFSPSHRGERPTKCGHIRGRVDRAMQADRPLSTATIGMSLTPVSFAHEDRPYLDTLAAGMLSTVVDEMFLISSSFWKKVGLRVLPAQRDV